VTAQGADDVVERVRARLEESARVDGELRVPGEGPALDPRSHEDPPIREDLDRHD